MDSAHKYQEGYERDRKRARKRQVEARFARPGKPGGRSFWVLAGGIVLSLLALAIWIAAVWIAAIRL